MNRLTNNELYQLAHGVVTNLIAPLTNMLNN
ncbi:hypothetical protein IX308_001355 [Porphyromonas levii]|nr:hypothetical protein [Porphyromonas levii]MBR8785160.1 hypothetical protein [Porphyromonas levii]